MKVRSAAPQDFDAVTDLLERLGRAEVTDATRDRCREIYAAQISDPGIDHLVAEDDSGAVVAFCSLHFRNRLNHPTAQAWIPDLFVLESARRQGIANALLSAAEERALARNCWDLTLESGYQRTEAHQLYESFGMRDAAASTSASCSADATYTGRGVAWVWWPIRSSKPAGRGSPPLGRFDSFAAPLAEI